MRSPAANWHQATGVGLLVGLMALALPSVAAESLTQADLDREVARARAQGKTVLLHFAGRGWCSECGDLETEVLKTSDFKDYTQRHFVLVEISLSADEESPLVDKFNVSGWPALVLLDRDGQFFDQVPGYRKGAGPKAVLQKIEEKRQKLTLK